MYFVTQTGRTFGWMKMWYWKDKEESAEQVIGNYLSASEERNSRLEKLLVAFQREKKVLNFR